MHTLEFQQAPSPLLQDIMVPLPMFPFPFPQNRPPSEYNWEGSDISDLSTSTAFRDTIDRDQFLGERRCVICGVSECLLDLYCPVLPDVDPEYWSQLKSLGWVPVQSKSCLEHEPRAGLLLCPNHWASYNANRIFIRFLPQARKFVFINYSCRRENQKFHGKAVALDINDRYAPFPALFILHEIRVRAKNPFKQVAPDIPDEILRQDWIISDGVFDNASASFKRDSPLDNGKNQAPLNSTVSVPFQFTMPDTEELPPGMHWLPPPNAEAVAEILAATRASASWKAYKLEDTTGLARPKKI